MSETTAHPLREQASPPDAGERRAGGDRAAGADATAEFERLYRAQVDAVTAFFARRSADPQTVADLTADTFVQVIVSFATFDPGKGSARAWVFGIARRIYAAHCEAHSQQRDKVVRLAGRRDLDQDKVEELLDRIDAERAGRRLVTELTALPALDRAVVELVDIAGLRSKEAASVLGVSPGAVRMRLMRAQRIYRFRLTRSGRVSGFAVVPGAPLGNRLWEADAMAASPDGSRVAVAFYYDGSSGAPHPDYIVVVNTATGAQSVWRGGTARLGPTFSVASLSWTGNGRELVFLGQYCRTQPGLAGAGDSEQCGGGTRRTAEVRTLDPASGGGRLDSGRLLLGQSARFPYIAQALISPDGSTVTAIVLRGAVKGSHATGGAFPRNLSVEQISVATGARPRVLYRRGLGPTSQVVGAPDALILSQDVSGRYWMLNGGISGGHGYSNGFNGWIYRGRLVPLPPADGYVAAEAW